VLGNAGNTGLSILLLVVAIGPVIAMAWFAWWFLRAGKRYDEQERAAGRRPPPGY
jgi:predicted permease